MCACVSYSSLSICILLFCLYKNSSTSVPKSTPDYSTVKIWIQEPSWNTTNLKDKKLEK